MRATFHHILLSFALPALLAGTVSGQVDSSPNVAPEPCQCGPGHCNVTETSLIRLIATPEHFENTCVSVTGYVRLDFEGHAVYASHDDYLHYIPKNGLWLEFDPGVEDASLADHYVDLVGRFTATRQGHLGGWSGTLTVSKTYIMPWNKKALGIRHL